MIDRIITHAEMSSDLKLQCKIIWHFYLTHSHKMKVSKSKEWFAKNVSHQTNLNAAHCCIEDCRCQGIINQFSKSICYKTDDSLFITTVLPNYCYVYVT